jgi:hypothetical protein
VLAPGATLEFAHPIVGTAIYESIPPGERALVHARAALLLQGDGDGAERVALHLLHSEPDRNQQVTAVLRAAATVASGRGAPGTAADYRRRALAEPPLAETRPAVLLELGLALASDRSPAAVSALRRPVEPAAASSDRPAAALLAARVLGIWGHHDAVIGICHDALAAGDDLGPAADDLEAELLASSLISTTTAASAWARAHSRLSDPDAPGAWRIYGALYATSTAQPGHDALARLAPVLASGLRDISPSSLATVYVLLVLIVNDELATASQICDQGSMSMVAHASCLRSVINRRLGKLEDAAAACWPWTSSSRPRRRWRSPGLPPSALRPSPAWAVSRRQTPWLPPPRAANRRAAGCTRSLFWQARGALRVAQRRPAEALDDLTAAGAGWRDLGIDHPAIASWRTAAHTAAGHPGQAAALAGEQLALARKTGTAVTLGSALRAYAAAVPAEDPEGALSAAVSLLDPTPARYELALTLADLGAHLRRTGRRSDARAPLRRALTSPSAPVRRR